MFIFDSLWIKNKLGFYLVKINVWVFNRIRIGKEMCDLLRDENICKFCLYKLYYLFLYLMRLIMNVFIYGLACFFVFSFSISILLIGNG